MSVRVTEIVDGLRVPVFADAEQGHGQEAILSHDDKVDEESGSRLDHTDLAVRHGDEPASRNIINHTKHDFNLLFNYLLSTTFI